MQLYGQDAEVRLLGALVARLDDRTMIDVGAERGGLAQAMLDAGIEGLHVFDPHPRNATLLRDRFGADARVTVHECAVSDGDGDGELHLSHSPHGEELSFGHTLLEPPNTDEVVWTGVVQVKRRSLASMVEAGEIPPRTGVVKIDTEGHDLAVVHGMGPLQADVVMVEHWTDLPHGLGACPWTADEMCAALAPRGFQHFAFVVHRGEFVTLKWDDAGVEGGAMGNLIFFHDRVLGRVASDVLAFAGALAEEAVRVGQRYAEAAHEREQLIRQLKQTADERLALVEELHQVAAERLAALEAVNAELNARIAGRRGA